MSKPLPEWLAQRIDVTAEGCWNWTAALDAYGYGDAKGLRGTVPARKAHRAAYLALVGTIPDGLVIDHLCHNRACVNPDHLEPVTQGENQRRYKATIQECPSGHRYEGANLYVDPRGGRQCRECRADAQRRLRERRAAA